MQERNSRETRAYLVPIDGVFYRVHFVRHLVGRLPTKDEDALLRSYGGQAVAQTLVGKVKQFPGVCPAVLLGVVPL